MLMGQQAIYGHSIKFHSYLNFFIAYCYAAMGLDPHIGPRWHSPFGTDYCSEQHSEGLFQGTILSCTWNG